MSLKHFCGGNKLSAQALRSWYCEHEHLMWGPPIICCSSINCIRHKFYSKMYSFIEHSYTQTHLCKRPRSLSICLSCIPNATSSSHNATEQRKKIELREHFPLKQNQTNKSSCKSQTSFPNKMHNLFGGKLIQRFFFALLLILHTIVISFSALNLTVWISSNFVLPPLLFYIPSSSTNEIYQFDLMLQQKQQKTFYLAKRWCEYNRP